MFSRQRPDSGVRVHTSVYGAWTRHSPFALGTWTLFLAPVSGGNLFVVRRLSNTEMLLFSEMASSPFPHSAL